MSVRYFDAHSHIHFPQYAEDRDEVLARMKEAGVSAVVVGTDVVTSGEAVEFAEKSGLYATVGLHPSDTHDETIDISAYKILAESRVVVAIGECGLDYSRIEGNAEVEKSRQKDIFLQQLKLAGEIGKPAMIHCRASGKDSEQNTDAHEDAITLIVDVQKEYPNLIPILHFFTGSHEIAQRYAELGGYFSFSGVVTFAPMYDKTVASVPLERILTETDAPYASPAPYRGKRNEPSFVVHTLSHIADVRGIPESEMREQVLMNTQAAFGILFRGTIKA